MTTTKNTDTGEVLKDYAFRYHTTYPWAEWTDGKARRLTRGKHFHCTTIAMATSCYAQGRKLRKEGKNVKVTVNNEDANHVVIQFTLLPGKPAPSTYKKLEKKSGKKSKKPTKKTSTLQVTNS